MKACPFQLHEQLLFNKVGTIKNNNFILLIFFSSSFGVCSCVKKIHLKWKPESIWRKQIVLFNSDPHTYYKDIMFSHIIHPSSIYIHHSSLYNLLLLFWILGYLVQCLLLIAHYSRTSRKISHPKFVSYQNQNKASICICDLPRSK